MIPPGPSPSASLEESRRALGWPALGLDVVRRFPLPAAAAPALAASAPWLPEAAASLARTVPRPPTVAPFVDAPFYRVPGSIRSICYCPAMPASGDGAPGGAVVAIKGLEPGLPDFERLLGDLRRPGFTPHAIAEHFVFEERKIPGCLGLAEALREAERAAAAQERHLRHYGELARLPLPLVVHRHAEETTSRVRDGLRTILGADAFALAETLLAGALGVYVYHYPAAPIRAREIDALLAGLGFRERLLALLREGCDPGATIEGWVRLFVRLLYLGFLPGTLASLRTGLCCQPQNACLDGGFVDLDSLAAPAELADEAAILGSLQLGFDALLRSVRSLVTGSDEPDRAGAEEVRVDLHGIARHVWALIDAAVESEARPGLILDPTVRRWLAVPRRFDDLAALLRPRAARPSAFDAESRDFHAFGRALIRSVRP